MDSGRPSPDRAPLAVRSRLGKYRIDKRLAQGGFAAVYQARDTVSGISVALKVPHRHLVTREMLAEFRREVRLTAGLDHPNILPVRDAGMIDGVFYVCSPLGIETLTDRLARRLAPRTMLDLAGQMIEAVAYAHRKRIMHCDIKPDNFILFPENRVRLADFGIAKVAQRTLPASGSGTVGYIAPEQALGKPSLRSDVFSLGLVLYRMFAGCLPEWPYQWPLLGNDRLRAALHADFVDLLRKALEVDSRKRFADAGALQRVFERLRRKAIRPRSTRKRTRAGTRGVSWKTVRWREFVRLYRARLGLREACTRCGGPMAEVMQNCPWCGVARKPRRERTRFPRHCPRCRRGVKADWRFCAWCYGAAINPDGALRYSDTRYTGRCRNPACTDKLLMPFMRYCPWCRRKVTGGWPLEGTRKRCPRCRCGVLPDYWDFCPWCGRRAGRSG